MRHQYGRHTVSNASTDPVPTPTGDPDDEPGDRSVAIFYVDLAALAKHKAADPNKVYEAPFTIGIVAGDAAPSAYKAPILIDPKIRNDGGR